MRGLRHLNRSNSKTGISRSYQAGKLRDIKKGMGSKRARQALSLGGK